MTDRATRASRAARRRTGRRRGPSGTREQILDAAREQFAQRGYAATTVRDVAAAARVDPALVFHFFGSKDGLFSASMELPIDFAPAVAELLSASPDDLGEALVRLYLGMWEDPATGRALRAIVRSAASSEPAADRLREFLQSGLIVRLAAALGRDRSDVRVTLTSAQLVGVAFARYVLCLGPLAELDLDEVVAWVAPSVHRYLLGEAPAGTASDAVMAGGAD